jgi:fructose-1,6-bisphosphatase/inositol monophosphatase family enzyme
MLVALGLVDVALEIDKGFRPWDWLAGAYLADGVQATVWGADGRALGFGPDPVFERAIDAWVSTGDVGLFDAARQRFIVAASPQLAAAVLRALRGDLAAS